MALEKLGLEVAVVGFAAFMSQMKGMDEAIGSTGKAWEGLGGVAGTNMAEVGRAMSQMGTATQATLGQMQPLGLAMGAVSAAGTGLIVSSTMVAARTETLGIVLETVGRNAGYTARELQKYEAAVIGQGITTMAARQSLVQMAQAHIDLAHGADLARLAQDAAVIAGMNSSQAFETLITVIQRGSPVMARTMGLNVDFMGSYERLAEQLDTTTDALTSDQKMQARLNEVMAQGVTIAGTYEAAMGTAGKALTSLPRQVEEARSALGEVFLPMLGKTVVGLTDMLKAFNALEPAQKKAAAGFVATGTAIATLGSGIILIGPKLITLFQSLGPLVTLISDTGFAMKLLGAGASTSGLGLAGFAASAAAAAISLAALAVIAGAGYLAITNLNYTQQEAIASMEDFAEVSAILNPELAGLQDPMMQTTEAARAMGIEFTNVTDGWNSQYSPALTNARMLTDGWTTSLTTATAGTQALAMAEQEQAINLDLLTGSLTNATEVQRILDVQMGESTILAQTQEEAMSLLAWAYDTGTLSEEAYIAAGLEVLAVNEDSVPGLEAVQEAVENATGGMYGLAASAESIPGSMRGVVTAAEEASAAAEKMAEAQQKAWESFASSVESSVGRALEAYRSGNAEMLAEQQHALAEMLWNQTNTMTAMGQITADQAIGMKASIADEFGIMVSDTELATNALLGMYGDWAAGGTTEADDIIEFIQNIGTETETLVGDEEERIGTMISQWQDMQEGVGDEGVEIAKHYAAMQEDADTLAEEIVTGTGTIVTSVGDIEVAAKSMADEAVESFDGVASSADTMAVDLVEATTLAMGGVMELTGAIDGIPDFKKVVIEVEVIGDEAGLPQSPELGYYYMYQDLLQLIRDNPLEIEALFDIGGVLGGFGATAAGRWMDPQKQLVKDLEKTIKLNQDILKQEDITQEHREIHTRYMIAAQDRLANERRKLNEMEREALRLEKQRQDLDFLQEQAKLLELIREHGLDAKAIMGGIELGIDADVGAIVQAMTAAMQAIVEQAEAELGIHSDSTVFAKMGVQMMAGLREGIASMTPVIQTQLQMAVQPLALPGRSASPVTVHNEPHYHLTTQSVMRDGGLRMEFASMEMATR